MNEYEEIQGRASELLVFSVSMMALCMMFVLNAVQEQEEARCQQIETGLWHYTGERKCEFKEER